MFCDTDTPRLRVLVLSQGSAAGKTSLINRWVDDTFDDGNYSETVLDIRSKQITLDGEEVLVQIFDTPGDPRLADVTIESMKHVDAFMVVYDCMDPRTLTASLALRFAIIQEKGLENPPMILVGAKSDEKRRQIRKRTAEAIARDWACPHIETSARLNTNVDEAFVQVIREHRARRRTVVHERRSSAFFTNIFPTLRTWDSTGTYGRVMKTGWLHKRGHLRANWKRRHVTIYDDGSVQYFASEDAEIPRGEFNLRDVWQIMEYREHGHEDAFVLQTNDRDWYFSAIDSSEKDAWLTVVVELIADFASQSVGSSSRPSLKPVSSSDRPSVSDRYFEERERLSQCDIPLNLSAADSVGMQVIDEEMSGP